MTESEAARWGGRTVTDFRAQLEGYGITASMSRRGNCWDNACSETRFGSLKVERLHGQRFVTPRHAMGKRSPGCSGTTAPGYTPP